MHITIHGSVTDPNGDKEYACISLSTYGPYDLSIQVNDGTPIELNREQMDELAKAMKFLLNEF